MGKTTFAKSMRAWLSEDPKQKEIFGSFHRVTDIEEAISVPELLLPPWWSQWKGSHPAGPACWIIDGLDECDPDHHGIRKRIVREIAEVPATSHRAKLRLIVLSRDRDWLKEFEDELRPLCREIGSDGPLVLRMAPLDRDDAARMLGSRSAFNRVAGVIERCGDLAAIAGYPRVLTFLREWKGEGPLSAVDVWEGILKDLLEEHNRVKRTRFSTEPEQRFEAVARIAVVCSLSRQVELYLSGGESITPGLTLADVFPLSVRADRPRTMREAAREAIRIGGPFRSSIEGGFRFGQRNIRDWFCAFGLRDLELERLRSTLAEGDKPLPYLMDMLHLLKLVSRNPDVRAWLAAILIPFGPSSSDAPWGLEEALRQLDDLERLASQSPSNLYLHDDENLKRLEAPGLGKQIASRLKDRKRSATVLKLLLDVASALDTPEAVAPALDIVLDETQDGRLREWAAIVARKIGSAEDMARLDGPIATTRRNDDVERSLQAQVILTLLVHGVWTVRQAAHHAPPENPEVTDSTSFLIYEMEKRATADDARAIISSYLDLKRRGKRRTGDEAAAMSYRQKQLLVACIERLIEAPRLSEDDQRLLARLSFRVFADPDEIDLHHLILQRLRREAYGRRYLYRRFAASVKKGKPRPPIYLRRILGPESHFRGCWSRRNPGGRTSAKSGPISICWPGARVRSKRPTGPCSNRAQRSISRHAPSIPEEVERAKREIEQKEREIEEERQRRRGKVGRHALAEIVNEILGREDRADIDRLRQLSLLCFSGEIHRYRNVDGNWSDLDADRQRRVLEVCRNGLKEGTPTPFQDERTLTTWNLAEAQVLMAALETWPEDESLDARMIQKWLPTILRTRVARTVDAVSVCARIDLQATTDALIAHIEAELARGEDHVFFAGFISARLWPGPVPQRLVTFARDESLAAPTRAAILETLAEHESSSALPLAVEWTDKEGLAERSPDLYHKALECETGAGAFWSLAACRGRL